MKRRSAFSLVELITALGGVTLLLSLTAVLLTRAMRSQTETRRFFDAQRHALALNRQYRDDVHQARSAELDQAKLDAGELVRLTQENNKTVTYQKTDRGVARVLSRDGRPAAREEYDLGGAIEAAVTQEGAAGMLQLSIKAPDETPPAPEDSSSRLREKPALLSVEAMLNADARYSNRPAAGGGSP
jgi:type II secretory pathway pseudopilin PulG